MNLTLPMDGVQDEEDAAADAETKEAQANKSSAEIIELHRGAETETDTDQQADSPEGGLENSPELSNQEPALGAESEQEESVPTDRDE